MTPHPIDTEALRREMEDLAGDALARDSRWAGTVSPVEALAILDLLAAAEHRATRAEAERDEWRQTALDERGAALDLLEVVKERDRRIEAVRGLMNHHDKFGNVPIEDLLRALNT